MTLCEAHNYTSEFSVKDSECGVGQDQMVTLTQLLANWVIFKKKKKILFIYFWLYWVFIAAPAFL